LLFIVDVQGVKLYHAGDTDFIPEMSEYSCDIALLPVSGTYVMDAQEASQAALSIRPKIAIPMHYGDIVGSVADARKFQDLLKGKIEVRILSKES
jgi:L-ascorbate metabolism protein UlaG (beta-lactamase superfamily)